MATVKSKLFSKLLVVLATVFFISFLAKAFLYVNRDELLSSFTSASEGQLYAGSLNIVNIRHNGAGLIHIEFNRSADNIIFVRPAAGLLAQIQANELVVQLAPGLSSLQFQVSDREERLEFEYTPRDSYTKGGLTTFANGLVALRSSTVHIGAPVLQDLKAWIPASLGKQVIHSPAQVVTSTQWMNAVNEMLLFLEDKRGIPNDLAETASTGQLKSIIENRRSQVWCSQISRYVVSKLSDKITVRLVGAGGELGAGKVRTGGHVFLEVLEPKSNRWVLSDPTSYVVGVYWPNEIPLNAKEFQHLFGFPDAAVFDTLIFFVADIKSKQIVKSKWEQLPEQLRLDWAFYFSPLNRLFYFSGKSYVHDRSTVNKIEDWIQIDRRFVLSGSGGIPIVANIRVWSFWVMVMSAVTLISGVGGRFFFRRRNIFRSRVP